MGKAEQELRVRDLWHSAFGKAKAAAKVLDYHELLRMKI